MKISWLTFTKSLGNTSRLQGRAKKAEKEDLQKKDPIQTTCLEEVLIALLFSQKSIERRIPRVRGLMGTPRFIPGNETVL